MKRLVPAAIALALFASALSGCTAKSAESPKTPGDSGTATSKAANPAESPKEESSLYAALDASGANEKRALAALPKVLEAYRKNEPAADQIDVSGLEPQLVAYEVQMDMKQPNGKLTIWQWDMLGTRAAADGRLQPVTMKDMQSGLPAATPLSAGEKSAAESAAAAIMKETPTAVPRNAGIVKYWFFYDAGAKGNLLIAVGSDGFYRGSTFGGK